MNIVKGNLDDLHMFYDEHKGRLKIEFEVMASIISDWEIWILEEEIPIAVIVKKEDQGHISSYNGEKVGIRRIKWALEKLGINRTTVSDKFRQGHSLAKKLGFRVENEKEGVTHYVRSI